MKKLKTLKHKLKTSIINVCVEIVSSIQTKIESSSDSLDKK